jgi:acyl-CoA synthetase (AMP-forming)/AMP-acid ligase II
MKKEQIDNSLIPDHQRINNSVEFDAYTVGELFSKKAKEDPDKIFLICPGKNTEQFTYSEFEKIVDSTKNQFLEMKLKKKDRICIIFYNSSEFLALYFAGLSFGLTIVPINPDFSTVEMNYIINDSKAKAIFLDDKFSEKVSNLEKDFKNIFVKKIKSIFDLILSANNVTENDGDKITPYDPAVIIYTSGTTGNPKGAILSHLNLISDSFSISQRFEFDKNTRALCILPLFHNNGQITTLLSPLYVGGSSIIVKGKVGINLVWDLVEQYNVTWTSVMASILSMLLSLSRERKDNSLTGILCGGQKLTNTIQKKFEDRFHVPIFEGYGLTETTSFSCINDFPANKRKNGSIGKPLITNEMAILDENNNRAGIDEEGEICIRGYNVMIGYLGLEQKNNQVLKNGWFHSGDYGRIDSDGYYYFHGRRDSLIIKGGENIYPAEIENILYKHPDVDECAIIGIPDKLRGEEICAFIKIKKNKIVSEKNLKDFTIGKIADYKRPKKIILLNNLKDLTSIPKGPTKKILYRKLKEYYITKLKINENNE